MAQGANGDVRRAATWETLHGLNAVMWTSRQCEREQEEEAQAAAE